MSRLRALLERYGVLLGNIGARISALVSLAVATLVLARTGGAAAVGIYALLRVLPALIGVVLSGGMPGAIPYFLAGRDPDRRRVPLTVVTMALAGGLVGTALWAAAAPLAGDLFFPGVSTVLVLVAGWAVLTQLVMVTAKSCSQGSGDMPGANRVIFLEQFLFVPAYGLLWAAGLRGYATVVAALLLADLVTLSSAWARLKRRGFFRGASAPSARLARRIAAYGSRAQVGGVISLLNLRLDFVLISALAGPAVLGVYAIASKFAELIKIPTMAFTYVLYPRFARDGPEQAAARARRVIRRAGLLTAGTIVPLWFASFLIPVIYGSPFRAAIVPAQIILLGLALDGAAAVITGFLYGSGRPGLNSCAMAAGLAVTVALDVALIPRYGATGAAAASAVAYVVTALALLFLFWRLNRSEPRPRDRSVVEAGALKRR